MNTLHNQSLQIISIDPGDRYVGCINYLTESKKVECYQIDLQKTNISLLSFLNSIIINSRVIVIVENFINYNHKVQIKGYKANATSEMIGMLKQWATDNNFELILQTAAQAKIWTNDRLVRLGFLTIDNSGNYHAAQQPILRHTRDAYRHLIYWLNKNVYDGCITKKDLLGD